MADETPPPLLMANVLNFVNFLLLPLPIVYQCNYDHTRMMALSSQFNAASQSCFTVLL